MNEDKNFYFFIILGLLFIVVCTVIVPILSQMSIPDLNERCKKEGNISQSSPYHNGLERIIPDCCHEIDGYTYCLRLD